MISLRYCRALAAFALALAQQLAAHIHVEVGQDPSDAGRLVLAGAAQGSAFFVPRGEPFSAYLPQYPGGHYPIELTFSCEGAATTFPEGSLARVELVSVSGPPGGSVSFWEVGATTPTWTRPSIWSGAPNERPSVIVYEDGTGYGHFHGRAFTVTDDGSYTLVFRALDDAGARAPSAPFTFTLEALATPRLALSISGGTVHLTFQSRPVLTYDLQSSTDLVNWTAVAPHTFVPGTGGPIELADPHAGRAAVYYRLVEYE